MHNGADRSARMAEMIKSRSELLLVIFNHAARKFLRKCSELFVLDCL